MIKCNSSVNGRLKISLSNHLGQLVQQKEIESYGEKIWEADLGKQPPGHYILQILSGEKVITRTVIIE
jgi:hypothetical protein